MGFFFGVLIDREKVCTWLVGFLRLTSSAWLWVNSGVSSISGGVGANLALFRGGLQAAACPFLTSFTALALIILGISNLRPW